MTEKALPSFSRCSWPTKELDLRYHDNEWGVPQHDEHTLFEMLILDGAQAGLSWSTILKKRDHYRRVYDGFDPRVVATYSPSKIAELLADPGIVRNRLKVKSSIQNAIAFLEIQKEFGSFDSYIWQFVGGSPIQHRFISQSDLPARSPESDAMSKDLKARGFNFVGSTICYAFMQAAGLVNDHLVSCYRYPIVDRLE